MHRRAHTDRDERGVAMIMTIIVIMIAASLAALILTQGTSTERRSGRGANWNEALQAADAGVNEAVARLEADAGVVPAVQPLVGQTADGSYEVTVQRFPRGRYQIDSIGRSGTGAGLQTERHVRVIMAPPVSFEYALFSLTDVSTKNNDTVNGDIWANGNVTVELGDEVYGNVVAATGYVTMENNSLIEGDVETGGYNSSGEAMDLRQVVGNVKASSTSPNCSDDAGHSKYRIVGGTVTGNAQSWGATISSTVTGTKITHVCTAAPETKPMPTFNFNPALYDPTPTTFASVAAFQTFLGSNGNGLSGVYFVSGAGTINLNGLSVGGDLMIIAEEAQIWSNGVDAANNSDKLFILVTFYDGGDSSVCTDNGGNPDGCAIGLKNNFQPSDNTATLIYAPNGPVAFKNNAEFLGAVYGSNIVLKNNMVVTYDARVDQVLGFGPVTLERESWIEISD